VWDEEATHEPRKPEPKPDPVGKIEKRPFDKMVGDCLKKDGFQNT
jgi:hypothetical protein